MAHYAKVDQGVVVQVIVAEAEFFNTFVDSTPGEWIQTSYNDNIRKNFAGVGYSYDGENDVFYRPQPFGSWLLNKETYKWEAPIAFPDDGASGVFYEWDEETTNWKEVI
jgi:hypothetical protein